MPDFRLDEASSHEVDTELPLMVILLRTLNHVTVYQGKGYSEQVRTGGLSTSSTRVMNELPWGNVVWGPDPFKAGENPQPWLIFNKETHPFGDEEYMVVKCLQLDLPSVPTCCPDYLRLRKPFLPE